MTPEGRVKAQISRVLKQFKPDLYYYMPVQNGMGLPVLDYIGWIKGAPFAIEAKSPTGRLTPRQTQTKSAMEQGGGTVFVVRDKTTLNELETWLIIQMKRF